MPSANSVHRCSENVCISTEHFEIFHVWGKATKVLSGRNTFPTRLFQHNCDPGHSSVTQPQWAPANWAPPLRCGGDEKDAEECVLISEISQLIHQIPYVYLMCVCSYEHTLIKYLPCVRLCWKLCTVQPQAQHHICHQGSYPYRYLTPNHLVYAYDSQKNKYVTSQIWSQLHLLKS